MKTKIIAVCLSLFVAGGLFAQETSAPAEQKSQTKYKKAWEFGVGGTVYQFSRMAFSDFSVRNDGSYLFDLDMSHAVWGGNIYVARELQKHIYLDLQASVGFTDRSIDKGRWLFMGGLGLQWRLGEYFNSKYIDPYLRVGVNYMYKDFKILYAGSEQVSADEMNWILSNFGNKEGRDKTHLFPVALGGGVNMWLNDRFGIGLQADYLLMPHKNVANSVQGTVRLMWRFGGRSKKPAPVVQYVNVPVEKIVERVVEVEKIVEKEKIVPATNGLDALFAQIDFDFDRYDLTPATEKILDAIAEVLKQDTSRRFLITGQTDARGSQQYNQRLSERRAATVVKGLTDRGVPAEMLKSRGVGKRISAATYDASDNIRRGDRKTVIELVTNMDYWDYLK